MKKTIICSISMKENIDQVVYSSKDKSLPVSERKVRYPICAFLEKTMESDDELEVIILVKKDKKDYYKRNIAFFKEELEAVGIMRKAINGMRTDEAVENILNMFARTRDNQEFIHMVKKNRIL